MKKKALALFLLPLLLVSSCRGVDEEAELKESIAAVKEVTTYTSTKFSVVPAGNVSQFNYGFGPISSSYTLPADTAADFGISFLLHVPMVVTESNYYPSNYNSSSSCTYNTIKDILLDSGDPVSVMEFKKDGDNLVFYVENVSKNLVFYHVIVKSERDDIEYSKVQVYSRFHIELTYNKSGLLISETVNNSKSLNTNDANKNVDIKAVYTYTD